MSLVALTLLGAGETFYTYVIGACLQTFVIGLLLPFALTEVADLDVDGRYIVLSVPAVGFGAMVGPGIGGLLSQSGGFNALLVFVAATAVVSAALIVVSAAHARPAAAVART